MNQQKLPLLMFRNYTKPPKFWGFGLVSLRYKRVIFNIYGGYHQYGDQFAEGWSFGIALPLGKIDGIKRFKGWEYRKIRRVHL